MQCVFSSRVRRSGVQRGSVGASEYDPSRSAALAFCRRPGRGLFVADDQHARQLLREEIAKAVTVWVMTPGQVPADGEGETEQGEKRCGGRHLSEQPDEQQGAGDHLDVRNQRRVEVSQRRRQHAEIIHRHRETLGVAQLGDTGQQEDQADQPARRRNGVWIGQ